MNTFGLVGEVTSSPAPRRAIPCFPIFLAAVLFCSVAIPAFASGDDSKPNANAPALAATPAAAPARPDRGKTVITNDDFDRMFPKSPARGNESRSSDGAILTTSALRDRDAVTRTTHALRVPIRPEADPDRYAAQISALSAELNDVSSRAESLRQYLATGTGPNLHFGLDIYAPCGSFTTDNEIQQLAIRRHEIQRQMENIEATAQENGVSSGILQQALNRLHAGPQLLSPAEPKVALQERQRELIGELDGVRRELTGMANQVAAQGMVLLQAIPNTGGNMTTNLIANLDKRAAQIKGALSENEDAARVAGFPPSTLR
jgi:hypothetical protein